MWVVNRDAPTSLTTFRTMILHRTDASRVSLNNRIIVRVRVYVVESALANRATCNRIKECRADEISDLQASVIVTDSKHSGFLDRGVGIATCTQLMLLGEDRVGNISITRWVAEICDYHSSGRLFD